jgi:[FeFe] hydrogenase H-cluster maturation GTPase HydF
MPQQQVIRDLLDNHAVAVVTQVPQLAQTLQSLEGRVKLVVTDSQAFHEVAAIVPDDILLTSFSILFARHKGNLKKLVEGVTAVDTLKDGDRVLIAEGCTHHRQCEDIGTVKIPRWLKEHTGKELVLETCSGTDFPADLSPYQMVIHCGGCTLHEKEMKHRIFRAGQQNVPIVNYGIFIAYVNGILTRSVEVFPDIYQLVKE